MKSKKAQTTKYIYLIILRDPSDAVGQQMKQ